MKDDPACALAYAAVLTSQSASLHWAAARSCPLPGYSAMIWPVFGSCSSAPTSAQAGSDVTVAPGVFMSDCGSRFSSTDLYSWTSSGRLNVVTTLRPPVCQFLPRDAVNAGELVLDLGQQVRRPRIGWSGPVHRRRTYRGPSCRPSSRRWCPGPTAAAAVAGGRGTRQGRVDPERGEDGHGARRRPGRAPCAASTAAARHPSACGSRPSPARQPGRGLRAPAGRARGAGTSRPSAVPAAPETGRHAAWRATRTRAAARSARSAKLPARARLGARARGGAGRGQRVAQGGGELAAPAVTVGGRLRQGPRDDGVDGGGQFGPQCRSAAAPGRGRARTASPWSPAAERQRPGEQDERDAGQRVLVGPPVHPSAPDLLRRAVVGGAHELPARGQRRRRTPVSLLSPKSDR